MMTLFSANWDLLISGVLILIALVLFMLSKMNILSQKGLLYVGLALLGAVGITFARSYLLNKQVNDLKKREEELREKEKLLEQYKKRADQAQIDLQLVMSNVEKERKAHELQLLENKAKTAEEREAVRDLSYQEISDRAWAALNN